MRINLRCPFQDKDLAKQLGARWDSALRVWYIENRDDLTPFARWLPESQGAEVTMAGASAPGIPARATGRVPGRSDPADRHGPVVTGPATVADCGCPALPWEACACQTGQATGSRS